MRYFTSFRVIFFLFVLVYAWIFLQTPPVIPLVPSPETTIFSGPLDARGYLDFASALNARAELIPPGENALFPLLSLVGSEGFPLEENREKFAALVKSALPKLSSGQFVSIFEMSWEGDDHPARALPSCQAAPWDHDKHPQIVSWLARNDESLRVLSAVASSTGLFWPRMAGGDLSEISAPLILSARLRQALQALLIRAMGNIYTGNLDSASRDIILACQASRKLLGTDYFFCEWFGTIALQESLTAIVPLISHASFTAAIGDELIKSLDALEPIPDGLKALEEKFLISPMLMVTTLAKNDSTGAFHKKISQNMALQYLDCNALARDVFGKWSVFMAAMKAPALQARILGLRNLQDIALQNRSGYANLLVMLWKSVRAKFLTPWWQKGAVFAELLSNELFNPFEGDPAKLVANFGATRELISLLRLAVSLRIHRQQQGSYPESLNDMQPALTNLPIDSFSGEPLKYRRERDGFLLYSFGQDLKDNAGKPKSSFLADEDGDLVISCQH